MLDVCSVCTPIPPRSAPVNYTNCLSAEEHPIAAFDIGWSGASDRTFLLCCASERFYETCQKHQSVSIKKNVVAATMEIEMIQKEMATGSFGLRNPCKSCEP